MIAPVFEKLAVENKDVLFLKVGCLPVENVGLDLFKSLFLTCRSCLFNPLPPPNL